MQNTYENSNDDLKIWLRLASIPRVGIQILRKLTDYYSLHELMKLTANDWAQLGFKPQQIAFMYDKSEAIADELIAWQEKSNEHHILPFYSSRYPKLLKEIHSPPPTLYVWGNVELLSQPQIAIVGSRNASRAGSQAAQQFAANLGRNNIVITSGMALGVDGQAHCGALNAGCPTIAVLAAGFCHLYPKHHLVLAKRIVEQGALVTEFAPHVRARSEYFPRRNRIISGLSIGVLVVEAAEKSGSLVTARYAAEQGRDVYVIPGPVFQPTCQGSNALIRQGAILVQNSEQILEEVGNMMNFSTSHQETQQTELFPAINQQEELPFPELLANVGVEATPIDIIAARTHIPIQEAMVKLLELELHGHVESVSGGYILRGRG